MADKAITYGASAGFGAFTGWDLQSANKATASNRATAADDMGDNVASKLYGEKYEVTASYKCNNDTNTIPASIGAVINNGADDLVLESIEISTSNTDFAMMNLKGHNHTDNAHATGLRAGAHGITLAKCFGATDFLGGTAGTDAAPFSGSITISCSHADKDDEVGDHLVGENYAGQIEARTSWQGVPTVQAAALGGWDVTSSTDGNENTGFQRTEVSGVKNLALT